MIDSSQLPGAFEPITYDEDRAEVFIALESPSGFGKSTLGKLLSRRWNGCVIHTLASPHNEWSREAGTLMPLPQLAFYLSGLLHVSDRARQALTIGPVIADRYTSSVVACQAAIHGATTSEVDRLLFPFRPYLVVPDVTFYLRCSEETLRSRLEQKPDYKQDDADLFGIPGRFKSLVDSFEAVAADDPTAVMLETDGLTPNDLVHAVTAHMETIRA
ncbi:dTMP kinase [Streptomyces sp. NPDC001568]|uniref:dTMP kinase n=1 Tax=Streptomyces sp. NPDC001568 TaxID=3364588 RepID=UPI00367749E3